MTRDRNKLGMWLFIASEAVFFALLIFAFIYFRSDWDKTGGAPDLPVTGTVLFTICLLSSSGTIMLAERAMRAGSRGGMRLWLGATVLLGGVFLIGQALEYMTLFDEGITISTGLFGTTFFTLTGFHGLHVFLGLIALSLVLGLSHWLHAGHSSALETTALYWHFVDVVWVFVFSIVYVWSWVS